ncbi:kinase-like protein [Ceratobasidium sp. AG-I]|nr:kinase-like protein [Ceratobasidium sp. AG-I]
MTGRENGGNRMYAVKVLRASGGLGSRNPTLDPYQQGLRRVVRERASIEHKNIITLLGLELSYGRYPGLVMEYCAGGTLESFLDTVPADDLGIQNRCMVQILEGLQFMHTLPSPLYHGDLTPHNILVDGAGTLKLTLFSFARLTANLSAIQMTATTDEAISARYLSPELLQEENKPTTHSDMWSFGCIACWMQIRLDPYFECKLEHQVVASILDNHPPYTPTQIMGLGPRRTGGVHVMPTSPWLTNGTWALVLRCWNRDETKRPNASACVRDIAALGGVRRGETLKEAPGSVSADVVDLSGKVMTLEKVRKKILGHSVGTWRRAYNYKGSEVIDIHYWWWKGTHSPRFYLRSTEVSIKGIRLSAGVRSGDLLDSARQCIYHEIALLRQLKHENICGFLGADHTHGGTVDRPQAPAIISEFCSNGTLSEYCSRKPQELLFNDRLKLVSGDMGTLGQASVLKLS